MVRSHSVEKWVAECKQIMEKEKRKRTLRKRLLMVFVCDQIIKLNAKRNYRQKRFWVHPLFQLRRYHGFYEAIFPTLSLFGDKFHDYLRITPTQFEELLLLIGPIIAKQNAIRESIPTAARLALTMRYLATGDCITSMSYQYLVGMTTACNIIEETCRAIWSCLNEEVLPYPLNTTDWLNIAGEFECQWNFNHCIGAIDGKHINIQVCVT
ncbi:PREDICTED: uncharacterized protein LOC105555915 [Vollenhovia emeryi]|uniref:uncharacterized protein LOC105555915 n=1 Tax=Vollenhovia emeryi TaxID=411798 RepID=UPI0005F552B6|nr:PREDICTED: uncharacterized protein LOC105555915 [Vollenhovia emeryi]